jgi:general secretion pathway protein I
LLRRAWIRKSDGFTLIEVLVAFMILAISLVVVMQLFSGSLKAGAVAQDYFYGIFHAQEKMEEILAETPLREETRRGEWGDGYQWSAEIVHVPMETEEGRRLPVSGYRITLVVEWEKGGRSRQCRLETLQLAPPPEGWEEAEEGR